MPHYKFSPDAAFHLYRSFHDRNAMLILILFSSSQGLDDVFPFFALISSGNSKSFSGEKTDCSTAVTLRHNVFGNFHSAQHLTICFSKYIAKWILPNQASFTWSTSILKEEELERCVCKFSCWGLCKSSLTLISLPFNL